MKRKRKRKEEKKKRKKRKRKKKKKEKSENEKKDEERNTDDVRLPERQVAQTPRVGHVGEAELLLRGEPVHNPALPTRRLARLQHIRTTHSTHGSALGGTLHGTRHQTLHHVAAARHQAEPRGRSDVQTEPRQRLVQVPAVALAPAPALPRVGRRLRGVRCRAASTSPRDVHNTFLNLFESRVPLAVQLVCVCGAMSRAHAARPWRTHTHAARHAPLHTAARARLPRAPPLFFSWCAKKSQSQSRKERVPREKL